MRLTSITATGVIACLSQISYLPASTPQPWKRHVIDASSRGADGVRAADANGDGVTDLDIISTEESNNDGSVV